MVIGLFSFLVETHCCGGGTLPASSWGMEYLDVKTSFGLRGTGLDDTSATTQVLRIDNIFSNLPVGVCTLVTAFKSVIDCAQCWCKAPSASVEVAETATSLKNSRLQDTFFYSCCEKGKTEVNLCTNIDCIIYRKDFWNLIAIEISPSVVRRIL